MDYDRYTDLSGELIDIAWQNYYNIEILKGYCENKMPEPVNSTMLTTFLENCSDESHKLINKVDNYTTQVGCMLSHIKL